MTIKTYIADLAAYLKDQGFGVLGRDDTKTSIQFAGYYEAANNAIFLTPYGGLDKNEIVSCEEDSYNPDFQIRIRHADLETANSISTDIYQLLRKKVSWDVGSTHFIYLRGKAPPTFLMKMNSGHYEFTINFSATIQ